MQRDEQHYAIFFYQSKGENLSYPIFCIYFTIRPQNIMGCTKKVQLIGNHLEIQLIP